MDVVVYALLKKKLETKADLVGGKIPASELPSYVDDVINGYFYNNAFYEDSSHTIELTPEEGKIYVDLETNNTYRWSGLTYIQIGGITVEANPTLVGTEPELEGLQIGDAKYKVPKGSYIVTPNSSNYITSDEYAYIKANYQTVPCFIAMSTGVYRIILLSNDILYTDGIGQSVNSRDATLVQYKIGSTYKVEEKSTVVRQVTGNPTLTGTEADLTGLQVGNTKYKVEQPINVEANPTLAGTESNLTGLQIGDTKYKLGYLPTSGGTMTGNIILKSTVGICSQEDQPVFKVDSDTAGIHVGSSYRNGANVNLITGSSGHLYRKKGSNDRYEVLDTSNTMGNPTLVGDEAELEGIQIGDTKYKVGGGSSSVTLYEHLCYCKFGSSGYACFTITNAQSTAFATYGECATYLKNNGAVMASGFAKNGDTWSGNVISVFSNDGTYINFKYVNTADSSVNNVVGWTNGDFSDTVTSITLGNIPNGDNEGF